MGTPGAGISLHQLLRAVVEKGASDLHITTGTPPQLRIDGALLPLKTPPLTPVDTKQLVDSYAGSYAGSKCTWPSLQNTLAEDILLDYKARYRSLCGFGLSAGRD